MDTHKNARLTPKGREEMVRAVVDLGMSKAAAARQFNNTPKTVGKWVDRHYTSLGLNVFLADRFCNAEIRFCEATCYCIATRRAVRPTPSKHGDQSTGLYDPRGCGNVYEAPTPSSGQEW
jgi:transposase-like protein